MKKIGEVYTDDILKTFKSTMYYTNHVPQAIGITAVKTFEISTKEWNSNSKYVQTKVYNVLRYVAYALMMNGYLVANDELKSLINHSS